MDKYYRILFSTGKYLAWAHGEFYLTSIKSYARLFTQKTLNNSEVKKYLDKTNEQYIIEETENDEKIIKGFIYE